MKDQKGITLVALIITIIVMLILVTVSVTVALNTGLFSAAQNATEQTNTYKTQEESLSSGTVNTTAGQIDLKNDAANALNWDFNEV